MLTRRPKLFLKLFYVPGILLFLAISVPWYYLVSQANPDFFYFFFIREHFLRFATKMHERFHPWYYFVRSSLPVSCLDGFSGHLFQ